MKRLAGMLGFIAFMGLINSCDGSRISEEEAVSLAEVTVGGNAVYSYTTKGDSGNELGRITYTSVLVCKEAELYLVLVNSDDANVVVNDLVDTGSVRCYE